MRRALIIDDEEAVLKIITHFIEMKDMPIKIVGKATSGDEAVDKIIGKILSIEEGNLLF